MSGDRTICKCKNVSYIDIRKAMIAGARSLDEVKDMTGAGTGWGKCTDEIEEILASVCGCNNVSLETVVNAVKDGANTTDKIAELKGAGADCGRCKALVENIIELER